jgi:hypothetical protein
MKRVPHASFAFFAKEGGDFDLPLSDARSARCQTTPRAVILSAAASQAERRISMCTALGLHHGFAIP